MKKVKRFLMTLLPSFFVLGMCLPALINNKAQEDPGLDTAIYPDQPLKHAQYNRPDLLIGESDDDDGDEEEAIEVDKVVLHYYNEAGECSKRAFYLWVTGVDGVEYNMENAGPNSEKPIMSVNENDTMMTITLDLKNDDRFKEFDGKSSLFFIVKFKMISSTQLNWGGQSDDMQLRYAEFPPDNNKQCEVWTMPAAGGGIAILDSEAKTKVHGVKLAKFVDWKTITCELTADTRSVNWKLYAFDETYFKIKPKKRAEHQKWYLVKEGSNAGNFQIDLMYEAHVNMVYSLVSHDPDSDSDIDMRSLDKTVTIGFDNLYNSPKFNKYYEDKNADGTPKDMNLGMTYTPEATTFRVWSPTSANMTVNIYDSDTSAEFGGEDKGKGYHMYYTSGGVWELTIDNLPKGKYYNYQVDNVLGTNVVMDPYATSAGCCGIRGYIYDKADTIPDYEEGDKEKWAAISEPWDGKAGYDLDTPQDLTIYEVHMQDFTGDSSWESHKGNKNGTYKAFVESGTTVTVGTETASTGYDHLKELGVGAVQLVPVFDHDNDESAVFDDKGNPTQQVKYNWGYNPLNYNIVEGGYSSNPHDGLARVKEFKNLVLKMSETPAHTRVIMDVVYNHVSSATGSNFHKLMPRYYFRYTPEGELFDGSGCHNEVASERPMMRKFIVDSLCMWAKEYNIKGFRFDLMGLIDFKTMNAAQKALYEIDPDIYLYGEGWSLGYNGPSGDNYGTETWQIYNECNAGKVGANAVYLGGFNDCFRNAVRGENSLWGQERAVPQAGFVQNGNFKGDYCDYETLNKVSDGLWGVNRNINTNGNITGYFAEQTVNYVSCHDNWTVRDQLFQTLSEKEGRVATAEELLRGSIQAHALVMASNCAAFILGGEELLRTKEYVGIDPNNVEGVNITEDSWTPLYNHNISHNSYNAPLDVNTFKWENKIRIPDPSEPNNPDKAVKNSTYGYIDIFKSMIQAHKAFQKKRSTGVSNYGDFVGTTSTGEGVLGRYWSQEGNFSNCVGLQANESFLYISVGHAADGDYIQCSETAIASWTKVMEYGVSSTSDIHDNRIYFHANPRNAVLFYYRTGK